MARRIATWLIAGALIAPDAAHAQFGKMLNSLKGQRSAAAAEPAPQPAAPGGNGSCDVSKPPSRAKALLGRIMNNVADKAVGRSVIARYVPIPEVAGVLTDVIACQLNSGEQRQAADATATATRGGQVGSTANWTSESRPDVSGTSTIVAKANTPDGSSCLTVNDVVIVNGEETTVQKRMCRPKGGSGYTLAA